MKNHQFKYENAKSARSTAKAHIPERKVQAQMTEHGMLVWMGNEIYFIPDWADEAWPLSKLYSSQMARRKYQELFGDDSERRTI